MNRIIVFSQNLKLKSLKIFKNNNIINNNIIVTTHFLFNNEKEFITRLLGNCFFFTFADFLTDEEMEACDNSSFVSKEMNYDDYIKNIKKAKNKLVISKILKDYSLYEKYVLSNDLGIDLEEWEKGGFKKKIGEYYYNEKNGIRKYIKNHPLIKGVSRAFKKFRRKIIKPKIKISPDEFFVGSFENRKYIFLGKMDRINYRLSIHFAFSKDDFDAYKKGQFETSDKCTYMTTWHEHGKCNVPDDVKYSVRWAQDGYLPPNYSHKDYYFKPDNVVYYCWDSLGMELFKNQNLPCEIIPFRKNLLIPEPFFPNRIKKILIVASGSGDWTALKNRSDDDILVDAIVKIAKEYPEIQFVYRCHPSWVHYLNVGVNSINRVKEYFEYLKLSNLKLSSNIPVANHGKIFDLTFSRSSLDEDLIDTDFVFGEHSISMIDAAFKRIPFASVNLTKRRNFFVGINKFGFPCCSSISEMMLLIDELNNNSKRDIRKKYLNAISEYNRMVLKE